jgi:hypothetical protein
MDMKTTMGIGVAQSAAAAKILPGFSEKTIVSIISVIDESSEPLTAAEIHYSARENFGAKIGYRSTRQLLNHLVREGRLVRREETDRERDIRTTENRGPNSSYYGIAGFPVPARTRAEMPTDPSRNDYIRIYNARKKANKKKAVKKNVRPASKPAVQTDTHEQLKKRIAVLEAQNSTLIAMMDKLLK